MTLDEIRRRGNPVGLAQDTPAVHGSGDSLPARGFAGSMVANICTWSCGRHGGERLHGHAPAGRRQRQAIRGRAREGGNLAGGRTVSASAVPAEGRTPIPST